MYSYIVPSEESQVEDDGIHATSTSLKICDGQADSQK